MSKETRTRATRRDRRKAKGGGFAREGKSGPKVGHGPNQGKRLLLNDEVAVVREASPEPSSPPLKATLKDLADTDS